MHRLPSRIAATMIGTVLLFVLTTSLSILWMTRALDRQALEQSQTQVRIARTNLLDRIRVVTLDYAKWDTADAAVRAANVGWLADNVGSAALIGQAVQVAVVWGGPFTEPLGWSEGGAEAPRVDLVGPAALAAVEDRMAGSEPGTFNATEFFAWQDGHLFAMAASHFEPVEHAAAFDEAERHSGLLLMGIRITDEVVAEAVDSVLVTGTSIAREAPQGRPSLAMPGLDGEPTAYVVWSLPRPGTDMLRRMLPWLTVVAAVALALGANSMRLMRRNARALVAAELHASSAARTDPLTGLPNRAAFNEALAHWARAGERAVLFLDLNGFKLVNDSLGHAAGDEVIVAMAARMGQLAEPGCLLARIAGDEFVLLVEGPNARARVERLAWAIDRSFDEPFEALGHRLHLQAAVGYAVQDVDGMTGADLMRQADLAMYEGKRLEARTPVAFSAMIGEAAHDAFVLERALRAALLSHPEEIGVAYQPVVTLDREFRHAEALARWTSPELGPVPPGRFIPVAEKAGLMIELGRVLLGQVCDDLEAHPGLRVSVNVSPLQLVAPDFIADLASGLTARSIDPGRIELELTESVLIRDSRTAAQHLHELKASGFSIALDDFGTGYSSVAYLEQISFNTLKIDRSFVSRIRFSPKRHSLIRGMIHMAHDLGMRVVCEGVETAEELALLRELGCDLVQGYLFDPALGIGPLLSRYLSPHDGSAAA
jgi:diguanylate cyclase (GGDEF)-like protein